MSLPCTIAYACRRYQKGLPSDLPATLIPQLKQFISTSDIALLSHAFTVLSLLLEQAPVSTFPEVERDVLHDVYSTGTSPLVTGAALDALLAFCGALVEADAEIATHVVPSFMISLDKAPAGQRSPANVAKCIAQVVKSQPGVAAGTIAEFSKHVKVGMLCDGDATAANRTLPAELQGKTFAGRAKPPRARRARALHVRRSRPGICFPRSLTVSQRYVHSIGQL